jgi:hypothetical protein
MAHSTQDRIRAVDPDALWKIFLLRGLGHSESEISDRLKQSGIDVSQEAVSYHLRRLRRLVAGAESEYRVLAGLMISSTTAVPYLMMAIVDKAQRAGKR